MTLADHIQEGISLHRAGKYEDAARVYGFVLERDPSNVGVLRLLGMVHSQRGEFDHAIMLLQAAARFAPEAPEIHNDLGIALRGRGAPEEAIHAFHAALRLNPLFAEAYFNKAVTLEMLGTPDQAEDAYTLALQVSPALHEARFNRAVIRFKARRFAEAAEDLSTVRTERPEILEAHMLYGKACHELGKVGEAKQAYTTLLSRAPESAEAHMRLGVVHLCEWNYDEARKELLQALRIDANLAEAGYFLGLVHLRAYEFDAARELFLRARQSRPDRPEIATSLGVTARKQGKPDEARRYFEEALSLDPGHADAHWHLADVLLLQGEYASGWKEFEWRWKHQGFLTPSRDFAEPVWDGEDITGQTILLHPEQGFGDILQFVRYAPLVAERGAKVLLGSPPELARLLETVPGIAGVVTTREGAPPFDLLCPLLSLPRLFDTREENIPSAVPYLRADPVLVREWAGRIVDDGRLRVGIIWSGNPLQENNRHRACRLDELAPVVGIPGVQVYSLQKGTPREELMSSPFRRAIIDLADGLTDFAQTAAALQHLDLLISSDTGPVHLAGALGRKVWLLVSAIPDWRWSLSGERSAWYPSFSLFRQERIGEWGPVITRMCEALKDRTVRMQGCDSCK